MFRKSLVVLGLAAGLVWTATAQDAKAVIGNASRAMGVDALKTVQYSATGFDFALGQAPNPSSPWPKFINKSYTRMIDFETPASRVDRVRMQGENPPRGGGQQPVVGEQPQNQTLTWGGFSRWRWGCSGERRARWRLRLCRLRSATRWPWAPWC